ncbi:MAG: hypothetical protein IAA81_08730 [Spirochaetes bacterium]|uniref:SPOR domain-containing protein n=1 Tax=Candidatus Gallitreponema excrementavium TaxID=2840840 RepID=A0A9D9HR69_9SPIR|nr:hypothetical protein [Candidatus Gallitreponema excrementavium]
MKKVVLCLLVAVAVTGVVCADGAYLLQDMGQVAQAAEYCVPMERNYTVTLKSGNGEKVVKVVATSASEAEEKAKKQSGLNRIISVEVQ